MKTGNLVLSISPSALGFLLIIFVGCSLFFNASGSSVNEFVFPKGFIINDDVMEAYYDDNVNFGYTIPVTFVHKSGNPIKVILIDCKQVYNGTNISDYGDIEYSLSDNSDFPAAPQPKSDFTFLTVYFHTKESFDRNTLQSGDKVYVDILVIYSINEIVYSERVNFVKVHKRQKMLDSW